ncbi:hypothetical protein ACFQ60_02230 [Streptomyces zhihengii]
MKPREWLYRLTSYFTPSRRSSTGRDPAVAALAGHDDAALDETGAAGEQLRQARTAAPALRDRHWPAIIAAGAALDQNGRVSGGIPHPPLDLGPHPRSTLAPATGTRPTMAQPFHGPGQADRSRVPATRLDQPPSSRHCASAHDRAESLNRQQHNARHIT